MSGEEPRKQKRRKRPKYDVPPAENTVLGSLERNAWKIGAATASIAVLGLAFRWIRGTQAPTAQSFSHQRIRGMIVAIERRGIQRHPTFHVIEQPLSRSWPHLFVKPAEFDVTLGVDTLPIDLVSVRPAPLATWKLKQQQQNAMSLPYSSSASSSRVFSNANATQPDLITPETARDAFEQYLSDFINTPIYFQVLSEYSPQRLPDESVTGRIFQRRVRVRFVRSRLTHFGASSLCICSMAISPFE